MDTKICRICAKVSGSYVHVFKTEGLKKKIETCLPITVSPFCLLPDTICAECLENVNNFYSFIKNCLQNIIILEAQYDITDSCLKTKRKLERAIQTETSTYDKHIQTDDNYYIDVRVHDQFEKLHAALLNAHNIINGTQDLPRLVDYDDNDSDESEKALVNEIVNHKCLKRAGGTIESQKVKIFKLDRRKCKRPQKVQTNWSYDGLLQNNRAEIHRELFSVSPQLCLLCDKQCTSPASLAAHIYEVHGIDMAQVISSTPVMERRKKLPNLVKISDIKLSDVVIEEPPTLQPTFVCPLCPAVSTNRRDLFSHLHVQHPKHAVLLCGLCLHIASSYTNLVAHLSTCRTQYKITSKYSCKICLYHDDDLKLIEDHIPVHDFILLFCKKQSKVFEPTDYIETNYPCTKTNTCSECHRSDFLTPNDLTVHRRTQHQIFQCDLCNKYYGRNSHLWKHVNRLHKGHPSITCQVCGKTSASKYHLQQHFNKLHNTKTFKQLTMDEADESLMQKFLTEQGEIKDGRVSDDGNSDGELETFYKVEMQQDSSLADPDGSDMDCSNDYEVKKYTDNSKLFSSSIDDITNNASNVLLPKEIDTSSNLYTNIITNYTPPLNEGEYKCPKCYKAFHKKAVLKKHKKNCRPRMQKDLLTRCKSCSRIFKDRQSLTKHLINYHSEYECEICAQKVQSKCEIVSHIRFSHPNCHLVCHCGNILRNKQDLVDHMSDHTNSFVCQFCADLLPTKIKLKMHVLSLHRKILSLSCGICLKLFESQHVLRDHVRLVHKDVLVPMISCTVCGKNYGSKWKTYDHLNKSHGRIFRPCKVCLDIFDTDAELQNHLDVAHNKIAIPTIKTESECDLPEEIDESEYSNDGLLSDDEHLNKSEDVLSFDAARISLLEKRFKNEDTPKKQNDQNTSKRTVYVNSNNPSCCEICFKTWPAKKHLWQHYIRCHKTIAATVCGICLKTNEDYGALQSHLKQTHPTLLHGQGFGSNFICRICGRYHNASSKLRLHMAIHEKFDWSILDETNKNQTNGYSEIASVNYESLIEQVECSSDSESVSDENESDDESTHVKSDLSSLESDSTESVGSSTSDVDDSKLPLDVSATLPANKTGSIFSIKPEELDSAIRSISYDQILHNDSEFPNDVIDLQPSTNLLNPHELQSAVNSIL